MLSYIFGLIKLLHFFGLFTVVLLDLRIYVFLYNGDGLSSPGMLGISVNCFWKIYDEVDATLKAIKNILNEELFCVPPLVLTLPIFDL